MTDNPRCWVDTFLADTGLRLLTLEEFVLGHLNLGLVFGQGVEPNVLVVRHLVSHGTLVVGVVFVGGAGTCRDGGRAGRFPASGGRQVAAGQGSTVAAATAGFPPSPGTGGRYPADRA